MIVAENLTRKYGKAIAVNNVSFNINHGEIVGLLGHNGAGKTTIMKMVTGFLEPTAGAISVDGKSVARDRREVQRKIGYLPENCPVYPEMPVVDYLEFQAELKGVPSDQIESRVLNSIEKTRLHDVALKQVNTLSRGYRQRLGVAQAILNKASILILDEPTNGLDPSQILEMRSLIKELSLNATLVISTHILQEVQAVCNRVLIINKGRLALDSPMKDLQQSNRISVELAQRPEVVSEIIREIPYASLAESVEHQGRHRYVLELADDESAKDSELVPKLVREMVERNLSLYSIKPFVRDLETVFREISSGKDPEPETSDSQSIPETDIQTMVIEEGAGSIGEPAPPEVVGTTIVEEIVEESQEDSPAEDPTKNNSDGDQTDK